MMSHSTDSKGFNNNNWQQWQLFCKNPPDVVKSSPNFNNLQKAVFSPSQTFSKPTQSVNTPTETHTYTHPHPGCRAELLSHQKSLIWERDRPPFQQPGIRMLRADSKFKDEMGWRCRFLQSPPGGGMTVWGRGWGEGGRVVWFTRPCSPRCEPNLSAFHGADDHKRVQRSAFVF